MGLRLSNKNKKGAVKKKEKEVKLDIEGITLDRNLHEFVEYEVMSMLKRIEFVCEKKKIRPVLERFKLDFESIN